MATELKRIAAVVDEAMTLLAGHGANVLLQDFQCTTLSESVAAELHSQTNQQLKKLLDLSESVEKLRKKASEPRPVKAFLGLKAAYYNRLFQYHCTIPGPKLDCVEIAVLCPSLPPLAAACCCLRLLLVAAASGGAAASAASAAS